ncbi:MAG: hypothetical protein F6K16_30730 [Symploca sp. SIO2B6]|nr:hypothetical protein [Symploca sp. SIO2B6]
MSGVIPQCPSRPHPSLSSSVTPVDVIKCADCEQGHITLCQSMPRLKPQTTLLHETIKSVLLLTQMGILLTKCAIATRRVSP